PVRRSLSAPLPEPVAETADAPRFTVSLLRAAQMSDALAEARPAMVSLPIDELLALDLAPWLDKTQFCAVLPRIYRTADEPRLRAALAALPARGVNAVGIANLGHLALARGLGLALRGEQGLNVYNSAALRFLASQGLSCAMLSFELRREQVRDLRKCIPCELTVYGRLPLMLTENRIDAPDGVLVDRRSERFPVLTVGGRSEIENAKVLYLADRDDWRDIGLHYARLRFTTETAEDCAAILHAHQRGEDCAPAALTRGLFYRGVE
ncbi:MAG: U32 family peptidase, partial [Oscillospiraceae bacterium]|nr:U32 family peptidase [Oscillospiraceae bacterium]